MSASIMEDSEAATSQPDIGWFRFPKETADTRLTAQADLTE
jgi:hypothetical protein